MKRPVIITLCLFLLTFAEGSREQDSLALVAMQEANPESTMYWDYSKPLDEWFGIAILDGRVSEIRLNGFLLSIIPPEIGSLTRLRGLFLLDNRLETLPLEMKKLTNLEELAISSNEFKVLPECLSYMPKLNELYAHSNKIQYVSEEIFELNTFDSLKYLILSDNLLFTLPQSITHLSIENDSAIIAFNDNYLSTSSLPHGVASWLQFNHFNEDWESSQKSLETDHLQIKKQLIPLQGENPESPLDWFILDTITEWSCITYDDFINDVIELKLNNKKLKKIPNSIIGLTRLAVLDLSKNFIEILPENMGSYKYLRNIDLSHNDITILPEDIISLTPINKLDVGYNNLKDIYMTNEMIDWLDTYDPDWRDTQGLESVISTSKAVDHTPKMNAMKNTLSFSGMLAIDSRITFVSPNGRVIFESALQNSSIDIPTLSKGLYLVSLESQDKTYRFKFVR